MENLVFQVSAKTARLIGRENISDVDGAVIELVKNGYDADADCAFIFFAMPYNSIPQELTLSEVSTIFQNFESQLEAFYKIKDGKYVLKPEFSESIEVENFIKSLSSIIIIDNGIGMDRSTLKTSWMNIGTNNKEINIFSENKKRIKTGAKGIGRFALDKLSLKSHVITKNKNDCILDWNIDWTQFDDVKLLSQVRAELKEIKSITFADIVSQYLGKEKKELLKNYNWNTGTIIILSPIREFWNNKLYQKVNANLTNVNPLGTVDKFDIIIENKFFPEYNFVSLDEGITRNCYDYALHAHYDGKDTIHIELDRNEIDIDKKILTIEYKDKTKESFNSEDFWNDIVFKKEKFFREDFNKKITFDYSLKEVMMSNNYNESDVHSIGAFSFCFYYLKNMNSTVDILKTFKIKERRNLLNKFSGIKIYRDNFKVRPYGDSGAFFDWLNLAERAQKSPAAASHESGIWRIEPYQVIGSVSIGRLSNPKLEDNANREGMTLNRTYYAFIDLMQGIINKFEYDRQYPLRAYGNWRRSKEKLHSSKATSIFESVKKERDNKKNDDFVTSSDEYTTEDFKDAILELGAENNQDLIRLQLLQLLSGAGVMAQTFSHEITRIATNLGSRSQHLKVSIDRLLNYKKFEGDEDFNPYELLSELDKTDALLSDWVNLIMDSVKKENFEERKVNIKDFLFSLKDKWRTLLEKKYITISVIDIDDEVELTLPVIDLHLLINNFLLNSAFFLEETDGERTISFKIFKENHDICFDMMNNGPELDKKYNQNPDEILNALVTIKPQGTGLGLWIAREAVQRTSGTLHVVPIQRGFKLQARWKK